MLLATLSVAPILEHIGVTPWAQAQKNLPKVWPTQGSPIISDAERNHTMFWTFILVAALALILFQLGAYSVWFAVLKLGLLAALLVIAGLVVSLIWRKILG